MLLTGTEILLSRFKREPTNSPQTRAAVRCESFKERREIPKPQDSNAMTGRQAWEGMETWRMLGSYKSRGVRPLAEALLIQKAALGRHAPPRTRSAKAETGFR